MTSRLDDLLREHAERLEQLAGPIELIDITSRSRSVATTVTLVESEPSLIRSEDRHRWPIIAFAAALLAIVVGGLILTVRNDDSTVEVPADPPTTNIPIVAPSPAETVQLWDRRVRESEALRIGFVGLPPVEARPSTPERGVISLAISRCTTGAWFDGLSMFADGRLIWAVSGRMVEQRLTPEGVELMRSEVLDSGLLDTHNGDACVAGAEAYYGHIEVVGEPYGAEFGGPIDDARIARLADPWSWLPESAWKDHEIKAFIPSEYSVLMSIDASSGVPAWELSPLSDPVIQELIDAKRWEAQGGNGSTTRYTAFTTDEARALAEALAAVGFVAEIDDHGYLAYHPDHDTSIRVEIRPRLPWEVGVGPIPG
jgi:hypothetical protein